MYGRYEDDVFVDGKIYRINEEVEEEEGIQEWGGGGERLKLWRWRGFKNEEGK